eukprot:Anaeramoba_ignava/a103023_11.p1 GENE.a103023_11~~a103023_11.p1  ORF type:complete len:102 (+),score=31.18 a103023_11:154-459(+)
MEIPSQPHHFHSDTILNPFPNFSFHSNKENFEVSPFENTFHSMKENFDISQLENKSHKLNSLAFSGKLLNFREQFIQNQKKKFNKSRKTRKTTKKSQSVRK